MRKDPDAKPYSGPAGGWGSVQSLIRNSWRQGAIRSSLKELPRQNKVGGFACVSCAWAKPADPHPFEFCENGAKATFAELTSHRATPEFFARHSVGELLTWPDFDLEQAGRLTEPLRYDPASDHYVPVSWVEAFADIGRCLKALNPEGVIFYASGRASLEASYMYQLFARLYGTNNLPDSSNMCHESTSVALPESIGVPIGTVRLQDFQSTDGIFFFGQNVGSNSPRMLHPLQDASKRGVPIITFNPLRERGLEAFINPQAPFEMIKDEATRISSQYHQVRAGGDIAAIMGMCKAVIAADDEARASGRPRVLDVDFIEKHTHGFEEFSDAVRRADWAALEDESGLSRNGMEAAAAVYMGCKRVIGIYGMGLTQHRLGVENVQMVVNLLLLGGHIGREGAGICPVRGHSNVQGQRTVGITEKPELAPLDKMAEQFGFEPPRTEGLATVAVCEGIIAGDVHAFIGLGGNFVRAVPDRERVEPAWRKMELTVQIATKLNRSHLVLGKTAYLLPCLGRIELDGQATGPQIVTTEDSTGCMHASRGRRPPPGPNVLSEPKIIAEMAKSTLPPNPKVDWDAWVADYGRVRDAIAETFPAIFHDFNQRLDQPGGFPRPNSARERKWETKTGNANFIAPSGLSASFEDANDRAVLRLITLRSNDQFNTTVYGYRDRFRGVDGTRMVVFLNANDIARLNLEEGQEVTIETAVDDGFPRAMSGFTVKTYDIPEGCCGAYYPECNGLIPLSHHARRSKVPAAKSVPVRIRASASRAAAAE